MNKKIILALLLIIALLATAFAACAEEESYEEDLTLDFEAYGEGLLVTVQEDWDGNIVEEAYGGIGLIATEGTAIGTLLEESGYFSITPTLEGDVFEGWMEYCINIVVDEDGWEDWVYERLSGDKLYTHEELLAMPAPDYNVIYVAKWASILMDDYFAPVEAGWEDMSTEGTFSVLTEQGNIIFSEYGEECEYTAYTYWMEDGQTLTDVTGEDGGWAAIVDVRAEDARFTGWNIYSGSNVLWQDEPFEEENVVGALFSTYGDEQMYIGLYDGMLVSENASTEELLSIPVQGNNYLAIANWN